MKPTDFSFICCNLTGSLKLRPLNIFTAEKCCAFYKYFGESVSPKWSPLPRMLFCPWLLAMFVCSHLLSLSFNVIFSEEGLLPLSFNLIYDIHSTQHDMSLFYFLFIFCFPMSNFHEGRHRVSLCGIHK